jgi:2-amino-4-hydroxy-6-hydroxymethyldihydropteridine diphosphokinase
VRLKKAAVAHGVAGGADGGGLVLPTLLDLVTTWIPAYIAVGSNLGEPQGQVLLAQQRLDALRDTRVILRSPLYRTRAFGPVPQPDFVNGAVGVLTQLDAPALLRELKAIETAMGRPEVHERWGPRMIDLDLLVYGRERRNDPDLTVPHPGIVERNFVLYPLADIAPDLDVPGLGRVAELKRRVSSDGIWPL